MSDVIPIFSTAASLKQGGIFTVEKAGSLAKSGHKRGPVSLCDLAKEEGFKRLYLVDDRMVNMPTAFKNLKDVGCDLIFGLKLVVCERMADKNEASLKTESKVIVWMAGDGGEDYRALIKLATVAAQEGFYYVPRIDWDGLNRLWHKDFLLALPFYSSFLAQNTLTFATIVPRLPAVPICLREIGQEVATDQLINPAIDGYLAANPGTEQRVKSIYYARREDAKRFQLWRAALGRKSWDKPNDSMTSREFCLTAWKELA